MERVLSDGVLRSQAQRFVDLTTIREDLTYSASLSSLHGLPPSGCVSRPLSDQSARSLAKLARRGAE